MQDPHPKVAGQGLKYLREHGVEIEMFDRDLQERIEEEDGAFIKHARDAAQEAKKTKARPTPPDPLDVPPANAARDLLAEKALRFYREKAIVEADVGTDAFDAHLVQAGFLVNEAGEVKPTGHGLVLFGSHPQTLYPQAPLLARIEYPDGSVERRTFDGPLILIPDAVEEWLRNKLPNVFVRDSMQRREVPPLPFEILREALINALVHRDYSESLRGANVQLRVTSDVVTVQSPGAPAEPLTLEQLQAFDAPMYSRNPELHFAFAQVDLAEKMGFGVPSIRDRARELGLPRPRYDFRDPYLTLTVYRHAAAAISTLGAEVLAELSPAERDGWQWFAQRASATRAEYEEALDLPERTARNHISRFVELGLLRQVGSGPATHYVVDATLQT